MFARCCLVASVVLFGMAARASTDEALAAWEFNRDGDSEKWYPEHSLSPFVVEGGILRTRATAGDPYMIASRESAFDIEANDFQYVEIRLKSDKDGGAEFFWANTTEGRDLGFVAGKERGFSVKGDGEFHVYRVYPIWEGRITRLRFDPPEEAAIEIDYIRIMQVPVTQHDPTSPRWDFVKEAAGGFVPMSGCDYAAAEEGLRVTLSADLASLVGPVVSLKSQDYAYATLHMTSAQPLEAALSWSDTTNGNFPGCNAIPFTVEAGGDYVTLNLTETPMWCGDVKRLRLDLTGKPGQTPILHSLSLGKQPEGPARLNVLSFDSERSIYATGDKVSLTLKVRNDGGQEARNLQARLTLGGKGAKLAGSETVSVAELPAGQTCEAKWTIQATQGGVTPMSVKVEAVGLLRPVQATTDLLVTAPVPELSRVGKMVAVVQGAAAVLGNDKLRLVFLRDAAGFQRARVDLREGSRFRTMGYLPYLARAAHSEDRAPASVPLLPTSTQADRKTASLGMKGVSGPITVEATYRAKGDEPWIDISYRIVTGKEVALNSFQGPWLWAGEGSFGEEQDHALFPGLEWLVKGERSSSTLDVAPPMNVRWAPPPNWITVPSMAVEKDRAIVGLMWDPLQKWDGKEIKPGAVFASPNFVEGRRNHLMGLFLPSIPEYVEKNSLLAKKPYVFQPGKALILEASIFARPQADITAAVTTWYDRFCRTEGTGAKTPVPALPPKPRDYTATIDMSMQAYEKLLWMPEAKGWMGVLGWAPGRDLGIASLYYAAARVRKDSPEATAWRDKALSVAEGSDDLTFALRGHGRPDASLRNLMLRGQGEADAQPEGARYTFQPDEQRKCLGPTGGTAVGIAAGPVGSLLSAAARTGDKKALEAGLKGLAFMDQFDVPRASQVWECPLHEPDILASGQACRAYLMGYRLTGDRRYLDRAVYWARTGLAFLYAWQALEMPPLMKYASIPVFGTSFYTGLWFGRPVQWNGLDYAGACLDLAPFDKSFPWRQIGEGVTISGMNQQATRQEHYGLYTDNWDVTTNTECRACMLSPGGILSNVLKMLGSPAQAGWDGVVTPEGWISVNGPGEVVGAKLTGGKLTAKVSYASGASGRIAVMPVTKPTTVAFGEKALQFVNEVVPAEGDWTYNARLGCVTLGVTFGGTPVEVTLTGIARKEPELAATEWKFNTPGDDLGWRPAHGLSEPVVSDGALKMQVTGGDPYFVGPFFSFPATQAKGIAMRARVSSPGGEFFWATNFGPFSPQREVSFQLPADGQFHEVFVELSEHPEWRGTIRQIRVDFTGDKGDTAEIEWVRVVRK